ncbi:MAG: hypothetical protein HYV14_10320 [Elusimicrobia bacterium]|nr:hypothetical protein [Elusimicrobiota bacterium]
MNTRSKFAVAAALLLSAAGCVPAAKTTAGGPALDAESRRALAEDVSAGWSEKSRLAARLLIARYGAPDVVGTSRLVWHGNGPWKRTIVRDLPRPYAGHAGEELGVLEQTVAYNLSPEQASSLAGFSPLLTADAAAMEMTCRADREEINFLRLNLANDILLRVITPPDARAAYARILELEGAGKTTPYLLELRFGPGRPRTP